MTHVLNFFASLFNRAKVRVSVRLDKAAPGAHMMWTIANAGDSAVTITKLVMSTSRGERSAVTLDHPRVIEATEEIVVPTDVDWSLLSATMLAAVDSRGHEHEAPERQLKGVQAQMREVMDRRSYSPRSARDFLFGAADLAFGAAILGLGFFMLMWVIATG
ncbi:MAG TPA: hypothetical protein VFA59_05310 [Vicinamibacterales bacterium]|nr:hypothetical protein [Vicinamibacterales bacterium]